MYYNIIELLSVVLSYIYFLARLKKRVKYSKFQCHSCEKVYFDEDSFHKHLIKHGQINYKELNIDWAINGNHICNMCQRDVNFKRLSMNRYTLKLTNMIDRLDNNKFFKTYIILFLFNMIMSIIFIFTSFDDNYPFIHLFRCSIASLAVILMTRHYTKNI